MCLLVFLQNFTYFDDLECDKYAKTIIQDEGNYFFTALQVCMNCIQADAS